MKDGAMMKDGTIKMTDGSSKMMKDGEMMDMDGR